LHHYGCPSPRHPSLRQTFPPILKGVLIALAQGGRVVYRRQYSLDETTWFDLEETLQAKTTVPGLPENTTVFFRLQCMTKDGLGDFSDVVAFFVR
jgi:hypothetical protein